MPSRAGIVCFSSSCAFVWEARRGCCSRLPHLWPGASQKVARFSPSLAPRPGLRFRCVALQRRYAICAYETDSLATKSLERAGFSVLLDELTGLLLV